MAKGIVVYLKIQDKAFKKALTVKLRVNGMKVTEKGNPLDYKYGVYELEPGTELKSIYEDFRNSSFMFLVDRVDYSISLAAQIKRPSNLNAIYSAIERVVMLETKPIENPKTAYRIRFKPTDDVVTIFDAYCHNRTALWINGLQVKRVRLTLFESKILTALYDNEMMHEEDLKEYAYNKRGIFVPLDSTIKTLKRYLAAVTRIQIVKHGEYYVMECRLPSLYKENLTAQAFRSYPIHRYQKKK